MQFPIVREYKTDVKGTNPENKIRNEPFKVQTGLFNRVFAPRHAPFFVKSLRMTTLSGDPLILDTDYEIFRLMPRLTEFAAGPVACLIKIKNPSITEGLCTYDVVGESSLLDSSLLSMIVAAMNDDRPVWWDNLRDKPTVFPPILHSHSILYDIVAFQDTIDLMNDIMDFMKTDIDPVQLRIDHYMKLVDHYITLYGGMLRDYLQRHKDAYNAHGLTALQAEMEKVDNFATAQFSDVLQNRADMHLRPTELKTIIDSFGFNTNEFMPAGLLPIAQFGNTNFIPPNLDGSYEGFGGVTETGGMCLESDGSITYLWNRMDGRTQGLYYSVMTNSDDPEKCKLTYTGFKYEHPRFVPDGANVNRIAQGSGSEVILVGDSTKNLWYIGLTNGSLDPAKHVYSRIDLQPIANNTTGGNGLTLFPEISIALMGDWIYIIQTYGVPKVNKQFWRVRVADVQATITVTPTRQNVSFTNADGSVYGPTGAFVWYTSRLINFSPITPNGYYGLYRSQPVLVAKDPNNSSIYAMKFLSAYHAAHQVATINTGLSQTMEINYDFNVTTGAMTLTSKTLLPPSVNMANDPPMPKEYTPEGIIYNLVFFFTGQGLNVFDDGRVFSAGAYGFSGFPRAGIVLDVVNSNSRHATVKKLWGTGRESLSRGVMYPESITSPIMSSVNTRAMMYRPEGEYYIAAHRSTLDWLQLFWKDIKGKFAQRPEVSNLFVNPVVSRPLTTSVRAVNAASGIGAATVVVPSSQLDAYGIDVGEGAFCMSSQKKYSRYVWKRPENTDLSKDHTGYSGYDPANVGDDDILLIAAHNRTIEQDGTVTLAPTIEIIYPKAIVDALINQVQNVAIARRGSACIVTVADPTFSSMERFGWLPVTVGVTYVDVPGANEATTYATYMVITPTYITNADGRKQVTGFTVNNIYHWAGASTARLNSIRVFGGLQNETPQTTLGPMRMHYYLNGNGLNCYFNSGIMGATTGDAYSSNFVFNYSNRNTRSWSSAGQQGNSSSGWGTFTTPDNGIALMYDMAAVSGGAATIINGAVNKPVVGSVYPETGWIIFFKTDINVVFNGMPYVLPLGTIDLRDIVENPANKVFYIYALLENDVPRYEVSLDKRLESNYQLWVGEVATNDRQIITIERFNVTALDGHRVSETKRGNSIPAASGLVNAEGQIPWLRPREILP